MICYCEFLLYPRDSFLNTLLTLQDFKFGFRILLFKKKQLFLTPGVANLLRSSFHHQMKAKAEILLLENLILYRCRLS